MSEAQVFRISRLRSANLLIAIGMVVLAGCQALAETITIGLVGTASATHWPIYVGQQRGFYAAEDIKLDMVFTPSSAALLQQLSGGSLDAALSAGIVDPIYAIDKGAEIGIIRVEMQSPPYVLMGKASIKTIADLKGKTVMVDGPKGITRLYVERMLIANGIKPSDVDMVFSGATGARFSALQVGAVDATVLLPPFNFYAERAGFRSLGLSINYTPELPFTAAVVNRKWASANGATLNKLMSIHNNSMVWFLDRKNRSEAIRIMVEASRQNEEDIGLAYDFLTNYPFFEPTGRVSRSRINSMLGALRELGDVSSNTDVDRLLMPGVTRQTD
jgi:NitT/TauT family transport system substrate-binding protein